MKPRKLLVFANDPLKEYCKKGELVDRYFNPDNLFDELHFISLSDDDVDSRAIQQVVGRARVKISAVGRAGAWIFYSNSRPWKMILQIASEFQPDCIRAYNAHVQGFLGASISATLNIPLVVSLHINPQKDIRPFLNPFLHSSRWLFWSLNKYLIEPFVLRKAAKVICAYNFIYEFVKNSCEGHEKIEVIYNRIDMNQFIPDASLKKGHAGINILCVGRLFKRKNPECLIKAMYYVNAKLLIIGDGPYRKKMEGIIKLLNLSGKVSLIPSVPNNKIDKYYKEADIFVSVNDYGGVSKVVIEAMASGLPVIVNRPRWESSPELLGDAAIIAENLPDGFAKALNKLAASASLRKYLGERNRKKALEINGRIMEQKEMEIYKGLLCKALTRKSY